MVSKGLDAINYARNLWPCCATYHMDDFNNIERNSLSGVWGIGKREAQSYSPHLLFFSMHKKNKNNTRRLGIMPFIQCISVIGVIVDFLHVKKKLYSILLATWNNKSCILFKDSHIAIFIGPTGCVKSHFLSDLIEKEYNKYLHHHYLLNTLMEQHISH